MENALFGNVVEILPEHDSVLLTLNRWLEYDGTKIYNGIENFQGTETAWDAVPLVFAEKHPDLELLEKNVESALEKINGRICGKLSNTKVETSGQPRLVSKILFSAPEIEKMYNEGKLSLSVAHHGKFDKDTGKILGNVTPNHVLVFLQDEKNQPRDLGAMLLNKETKKSAVESAIETIKNFVTPTKNEPPDSHVSVENATSPSVPPNPASKKIVKTSGQCMLTEKDFGDMLMSEIRKRFAYDDGTGNFSGLKLPHHNVAGDLVPNCVRAALAAVGGARVGTPMNLGNNAENVKKHLEAHLNEAKKMENTEIENKNNTIKELEENLLMYKESLAAYEESAATAEWVALKSKIPQGWLAEKEEPVLRKEYEENKVAFLNKLLDVSRGTETPEEGDEFTNKKVADEEEDPLEINRELRYATGRMR